jgi:hypothetical protein
MPKNPKIESKPRVDFSNYVPEMNVINCKSSKKVIGN